MDLTCGSSAGTQLLPKPDNFPHTIAISQLTAAHDQASARVHNRTALNDARQSKRPALREALALAKVAMPSTSSSPGSSGGSMACRRSRLPIHRPRC
jgi:hypothetical protein